MNKLLFVLLLIPVLLTAQSQDGLEITNISVNGGISMTQPLLPDDLIYDGLVIGVCLWWDRCGLEGGKPYTLLEAPEYVLNETYLVMTCDDKWTQDVDNYLTCTVNKGVTMYVLYDARQREGAAYFPSWLLDWEMMPDSAIINDCYGDSCKPRTMDVYKKDFPAGDIALGSNNENGYDFSALQYVPVWSVNQGASSSVDDIKPGAFAVSAINYPNPFNPSTDISYSLPESGTVTISVLNKKGEKIAELVNSVQSQGKHVVTWQGSTDDGHAVPSGVYLYRLSWQNHQMTKRMLLLR